MNKRTPMPRICFCVCRRACRRRSSRGNSELSSGESDNGAVRSPTDWYLGWSSKPRQARSVLWSPRPAVQWIVRAEVSDEQLVGFQVDQARGGSRIGAPALRCGAAAQRQGPVPWTLPDSPRRGPRCLPRQYRSQVFYCFACGAGGTVLDFIADMERCSLYEAAEKLETMISSFGLSRPAAKEKELVTERRKVSS